MTTLPLFLSCIWVVAANVAGTLPSRHGHWPAAIVLIATGVPILGLVTWQYGPLAGFIALGAGASILRWPLRLRVARLFRRRPSATSDQTTQPAE